MADTAQSEPGAPVAKDAIDPELVKLGRPRPRIGVVTAAGIVFLSILFLWRINGDRKFSGSSSPAEKVTVADIVDGKVGTDRFVAIDASTEPLMSRALRANASQGSVGLRVVPVRGTGDKLWLVLSGDGWDPPQLAGYAGRLRRLSDLPFWSALRDQAESHARPVFATADAVRAGLVSGQVTTLTGETVAVKDADRVAYEVVDPDSAVIVATLEDRLPDAAAWTKALTTAGISPKGVQPGTDTARFEIALPDAVDVLTDKLAKAELWAARVEPVTHHVDTTWAGIKTAPPKADLVGLYVARAIPSDAYALITGEKPDDYWYVLPVTIIVAVIGLLFAWALVRAVKRDLLPPSA